MRSNGSEVLIISGKKPDSFGGSLDLPSSKSYLHRALFISSLVEGRSSITNCGLHMSDDIKATIGFLQSLGVKINRDSDTLTVRATDLRPAKKVFVGGSGTTARLGISFACLARGSGSTTIVGDKSLSKRPMQPLLDALSQLGIKCRSIDGCLPVEIRAGGIMGGECVIDGSISSQFISSLLIACTRAEEQTVIRIKNPSATVSEPYIDATLRVLRSFGFKVRVSYSKKKYDEFRVPPKQRGNQTNRTFKVPADMSSAAVIIGATVCASGRVGLRGVDLSLPQADSVMIDIAKRFGAHIVKKKENLLIDGRKIKSNEKGQAIDLDLSSAPDVVPAVLGMVSGLDRSVRISNVGHLRFKESDRLGTLARGFKMLGADAIEGGDSIQFTEGAPKKRRKPIVLDPQNDHRMLMAFTIAGLSGRFGTFSILNPDCVKKSYPDFVSGIQRLCGPEGKRILRIAHL